MFNRNNFVALEKAITEMCKCVEDERKVQTGLKLGLQYFIKSTASILQLKFLIEGKDDMSADVDKFMKIFEMRQVYMFRDATYTAASNRLLKLRKRRHCQMRKISKSSGSMLLNTLRN